MPSSCRCSCEGSREFIVEAIFYIILHSCKGSSPRPSTSHLLFHPVPVAREHQGYCAVANTKASLLCLRLEGFKYVHVLVTFTSPRSSACRSTSGGSPSWLRERALRDLLSLRVLGVVPGLGLVDIDNRCSPSLLRRSKKDWKY